MRTCALMIEPGTFSRRLRLRHAAQCAARRRDADTTPRRPRVRTIFPRVRPSWLGS